MHKTSNFINILIYIVQAFLAMLIVRSKGGNFSAIDYPRLLIHSLIGGIVMFLIMKYVVFRYFVKEKD